MLGGALVTPYFLTAARAQDAQSEAPSDRPVIALIGGGGQGRWDMRDAMRFGDVAAVCDVDSEHAGQAASEVQRGGRRVELDRAFLSSATRDGEPTLAHGYAMTGHVAQGATVDELLTGRVPFKDGDVAFHHRHTPVPDPRELVPDLPEAWCELILALLAKKPDDRPASAALVAERLAPLSQR